MKILLHVDENEKWNLALENGANIFAYGEKEGETFELEFVANGAAVETLVQGADGEMAGRMAELCDRGAVLAACSNALRKRGIGRESLCGFVTVVPAGVVEIAKRESEGYAYIKP
ncbi:DsrE family protein [Gehongia tenuis]|uniref:DsrE family protein n=1 Tax=Gehongia tenuis TaxID=2763655 RepID=A0A926HN77_9FIRM|nr:DsrE family protein [Gehongia tenuis]MBC8530299.1 DsrE family protein [Gehongia tenuis]